MGKGNKISARGGGATWEQNEEMQREKVFFFLVHKELYLRKAAQGLPDTLSASCFFC